MLELLTAVVLVAAAEDEATAQRRIAMNVAQAIEQNYFDAAAGTRIASAVRREAQAGAFDRLETQQLAGALTNRLRPYDGHFHVTYAPQGAAAPSEGAPAAPAYGPEEQDRRSGYGFRDIAVLPGNIGYIRLDSFAPIDFSSADWPPRRAADAALTLMARTDAVIIDLRANGGGDPAMVGYLASAFVEPERDVYNVFHARDREQSERPPLPYSGSRLTMPVYVLVSGRTGSAAESLAYTLQAAGRASVVGETSIGAANPGDRIDVGDGWGVFVPVATPINPVTGRNWEGTGVVPDIAVPIAEAVLRARIAALETVLPGLPEPERPDARLTLEALQAELRPADTGDLAEYAGAYQDLTIGVDGGRLLVRNGRRPPLVLARLDGDLFYPVDSPSTRYRFSRDGAGRVTALDARWIDGASAQYLR